ncbi:MAG: PilZ domain-containing protein [Agarilytica sp.]
MTDQQERRRYTRVNFDCDAAITQDDKHYDVHLVDISLKGALIETPEDYELKADQPVTVEIKLSDDATISLCTHFAHSSTQVLGFQCDSIDMESMTHLRRLIELNMEDPNAPERVLDELLLPH